jgi:hypothetical protein
MKEAMLYYLANAKHCKTDGMEVSEFYQSLGHITLKTKIDDVQEDENDIDARWELKQQGISYE